MSKVVFERCVTINLYIIFLTILKSLYIPFELSEFRIR